MILPSQTAGPLVTRCIEPAPKPEHPGMSWAELARKEGHLPSKPVKDRVGNKTKAPASDEMVAFLERAKTPLTSSEIAEQTGQKHTTVCNTMMRLKKSGKAKKSGDRFSGWVLV